MRGLSVKVKWALLVGVVVVLVGCGGGGDASEGVEPVVREGTPQQPQATLASGKTVAADGQLGSIYPSLGLAFEGGVSGQVLTITVRPGDVVQAGDLVALLDESELQRAVDDAQLALDRAIADHERARQQGEREAANAEYTLTGSERAVDDAQLALDRAVADRERAHQQWERDVAAAEQALVEAQRALSTARLQYTDTPIEQARTTLDLAQQAEADAKKAYEDVQPFPINTEPYHDAWQRAIRSRELAEMQLADTKNVHSAAYLGLESREADVAQAERTLAVLQEGLAPGYARAVEDAARAWVWAQETLTHTQLTAPWLGLAPGYARAVEDAERALARAQETLAHVRLTAPWAAVVLAVNVAPGATIGPGVPVVTLLDIEDGLLFITHNLGEQHAASVYPGQRARVTLRAFAGEPLEGTVEAVIPQGETEAASAHFTVHVRLTPADPSSDSGQNLRLLPGMTGRVEIFVGE